GMYNKRLTAKERNLLKGSIRRVFSRSELRKSIINLTVVNHADPDRPRVKKWSICEVCKKHTPTYKMQLDHKDPIIPIDKTLEELSWDEVIDRVWCEENNLTTMCIDCHKQKTKIENKERRKKK